tara:strand:+ start:58 stop:312 length:255 start_codon:yes stop_codon:yes gene_type:complete
VDPFDAPESLRVAATGITPHEHRGMGIPNTVDFKMDEKFFEPICFRIKRLFTNMEISPETNIPKRRKGDIFRQRDHISERKRSR